MDLSAELLPGGLLWLAHIAALLVLAVAVYSAPWRIMFQARKQNVFMGSVVALLFIWNLKAGIDPGLGFHLLGGTLFTLMFGWQLALIGVSLVIAAVTFNGAGDWSTLSLNILLMAGIPVALSMGMLRFAVRHLPHNFFVYVLVNGYLCGGIAMGATVLTGILLLLWFSPYTMHHLLTSYVPFSPMMVFAEGFFTGMLAASLVLWRPDWVRTFDDRRYLIGK